MFHSTEQNSLFLKREAATWLSLRNPVPRQVCASLFDLLYQSLFFFLTLP